MVSIYSGGSRSKVRDIVGEFSYSGDVTIYNQLNALSELVTLTMGLDTVTGTAAPFTHTITLTDTIPWFTLERQFTQVGATANEDAIDCKMNTLTITAKAGAALTTKASFMAKSLKTQSTPASVTREANQEQMYWQGVSLIKNGTTTIVLTVSDWEVEINNQLDVLYGEAVNPADIEAKVRAVSGKFTGTTEALADIYIPMYGLSSGSDPNGTLMSGSWQNTITTGANLSMVLAAPKIAYTAAPPKLSPDGKILQYQVTWDAMQNAASNDEFSCVTTNTTITQF